MSRQTLQHLVDKRKWEVVLPCDGIQLSVVYAHPPSCMNSRRDHLIIRILHHCNSTLLWHHMNRAHPLAVGNRKDHSNIFKLQNLVSDHLFHCRVKSLCASLCGFISSSINILCMHIAGLIPLMSAMLHPMASLYFFNTCASFPYSSSDKSAAIITGSVSSSPKKMYFKCSGSGFNSNSGAFMIEGRSLEVDAGKLSNFGRYIL